jgi:hypothetical protein
MSISRSYIVLSGELHRERHAGGAAKEAGANVLAYGSFITAVINFLILAFRDLPDRASGQQDHAEGRRSAGRTERSRSAHRNPGRT